MNIVFKFDGSKSFIFLPGNVPCKFKDLILVEISNSSLI